MKLICWSFALGLVLWWGATNLSFERLSLSLSHA
jgi:hypothetical protein